MKKLVLFRLLSFVVFWLWSIICFSQTFLPSGWDFSVSAPTGWTSKGLQYYSSSGPTPPAAKLSAKGNYIQIYFDDIPGNLSYYISGAANPGTSWSGTFSIQQSSDGINWSALRTFTSFASINTFSQFIDKPLATSRYIRFYFTTKSTGSNIGLDDILLTRGSSPLQSIRIKHNSKVVNNNSTFIIGNSDSTSFTIINYGSADTLHVTNVALTGTDASSYSVHSMPNVVYPNDSTNFTLKFSPSGSGSRFATLSISNNDLTKNPYNIKLYGIAGNLASLPVTQPTNLAAGTVKSYTFKVTYTAASPAAEHYIVLRKNSQPITETPVNATTYHLGDYIGNAQVAYVGSDTFSFTPSHIVADHNYYFAAFAFNGPPGYQNFLTNNPAKMSVTTLPNMIGTYYSTIDSNSTNFISALHTLVFTHKTLYYDDYLTDLINHYESRDTSGARKVVTCVYSGFNDIYTAPFTWNVMSREHTFCESWMPLYNTSSYLSTPEYADFHNLFPVNQNNANDKRSNNALGVVKNISSQYLGCKLGSDANGVTVFEPRDIHKGDAARALFYMCLTYDATDGVYRLNQTLSADQDQNLLKQWNHLDPPDDWEMARNDYIQSVQGNRNPFIDHPDWVDKIDFSTMTPMGVNDFSILNSQLSIFPNPNNGSFTLKIINNNSQFSILNSQLFIYDILGDIISKQSIHITKGLNYININNPGFAKGAYFIRISDTNSSAAHVFIVN